MVVVFIFIGRDDWDTKMIRGKIVTVELVRLSLIQMFYPKLVAPIFYQDVINDL